MQAPDKGGVKEDLDALCPVVRDRDTCLSLILLPCYAASLSFPFSLAWEIVRFLGWLAF
jgi:hypothetical protein